jgi:hypothetical protein
MRKIRVKISSAGHPSIEVLDARGEACVELTKALEERLGTPGGERELKPEYQESEETAVERLDEEERGT